jgi:hypothetical protein
MLQLHCYLVYYRIRYLILVTNTILSLYVYILFAAVWLPNSYHSLKIIFITFKLEQINHRLKGLFTLQV